MLRGDVPDPFDPTGSRRPEPSGFAVIVWASVAGAAFLMALVAILYGLPERNLAPTGPQIATVQPDPTPTASIGNRFEAFEGGSSEVPAVMPRESGGATGLDLRQIRIENAALRQRIDTLKNQVDMLSERLAAFEDRLSTLTGSIDRQAPPPRRTPQLAEPPAPADAVPTDEAVVQQPARTRFGVELGSFDDLGSLKATWQKLSGEQPGLFGDLEAVATVRDRNGRTELLLVAGPFPNAADAATRCARVEQAGIACLPAFYLGQALSLR